MAIDWPSTPTLNQSYTSGSRSWICVSTSPVVWQAINTTVLMPANLSINAQTGTTYTPVLTDTTSLVTLNNAAAITVSIPTDASVAYPVGTQLNFAWVTGAGQPTIQAASSGTTTVVSTGATSAAPKLRVVNSVATAIKLAANSWLVTGDIA